MLMKPNAEMLEYVESLQLKAIGQDIRQATNVVYRLLPLVGRLVDETRSGRLEDGTVRFALHVSAIILYLSRNFDSVPFEHALESESSSSDSSTCARHFLAFYREITGSPSGPVAYVARKVLESDNGRDYTDLVARYLHAVDPRDNLPTLYESGCTSEQFQAYLLLDRIFQLKNDHIENAIDRILNFPDPVTFENISAVIQMDCRCPYYDKASILCNRLYDRLVTQTIGLKFLETVAQPQNETLLFRALHVTRDFCRAYCTYLIGSLRCFRYNRLYGEFEESQSLLSDSIIDCCVSDAFKFNCLIVQLAKLLNTRQYRNVRDAVWEIYNSEQHELDECVVELLHRQCFVNSYDLYESFSCH